MKEFDDFAAIIERLRAKNGCPWDREQTHVSLRGCMLEEAYEVAEGIDRYETTGNFENMKEELGDVLLQVALHCQIAKEEGLFTIEDVIREVSDKMIRRHPHVFGEQHINDTDEVLRNWEEIKKEEKKEKKEEQGLSGVPKAFPALLRAQKVNKKAEKMYGNHLSLNEVLVSAFSLLDDLIKSQNAEHNNTSTDFDESMLQIGRLLYEIAKICEKMKISAEDSLVLAIEEKIKEYEPKDTDFCM